MKHKTRIPTKHMNTHTYTHTATLEEIMYTERRKLKKKKQRIVNTFEIYQELLAIKKKEEEEYSEVLRMQGKTLGSLKMLQVN